MTAAAQKPVKTSKILLDTNTHKWLINTSQDPNTGTGTVTIELVPGEDLLQQRMATYLLMKEKLLDITRDPKATFTINKDMDGATFETPFAAEPSFARSVEMTLQPLGKIQSAGASRA